MSSPPVSFSEEIEEKGHRFSAVFFKLGNAVLVFFYEGDEIKLGTLAAAMPQFEGKMCISSILMGERNTILTKILAERFSNASKGIALVSTHLAEITDVGTSATLIKLTKKLLDKATLK